MSEPELVSVAAGPVLLGVPAFGGDASIFHAWYRREVEVPSFAIAKYPVTVGEYLHFADRTGYAICEDLRTDPRFADPQAPAAFVSWIDAVRYTQWLARETGKPYRLPRDAEYEKAARGGLSGKKYPWGDEPPQGRADCGNPQGSPQAVGTYAPNGYGLYDMAGAVWCWCEECFDDVVRDFTPDRSFNCYDDTALRDTRLNAICRGGSFKTADTLALQCAYRHEDPIDGRFDCIGFRVALGV